MAWTGITNAPGADPQSGSQIDTTREKEMRPKITRRKTAEAELSEMGPSLGEAQLAAKDSDRWRNIIDASCPTGGEEDK